MAFGDSPLVERLVAGVLEGHQSGTRERKSPRRLEARNLVFDRRFRTGPARHEHKLGGCFRHKKLKQVQLRERTVQDEWPQAPYLATQLPASSTLPPE